jgi:hypothetical protein
MDDWMDTRAETHELFGYIGPDNSTLHLQRRFAEKRDDDVYVFARVEDFRFMEVFDVQ